MFSIKAIRSTDSRRGLRFTVWVPRILKYPAESVVTATKHIGTNVTHAYLTRPMLIRVVPIASAADAMSWLAMPNIGQIVLISPVQMKWAQDSTMMLVAITDEGIESGLANGV